MVNSAQKLSRNRVFKTAWFAKAARKAKVRDPALCAAMHQVMLGLAEDLGGGVFKKRLNDNTHRSIILAKGGRHWVYEYLFAKNLRSNIDADELLAFRSLAKAYAALSEAQIALLLAQQDLMEICHEDQAQIQE